MMVWWRGGDEVEGMEEDVRAKKTGLSWLGRLVGRHKKRNMMR